MITLRNKDDVKADTVFPLIVAGATYLFFFGILGAEIIQGRKLFTGGNYILIILNFYCIFIT